MTSGIDSSTSIGKNTYELIKGVMQEGGSKMKQGLKTLCWNTSIGDSKIAFTIGAGGLALGVFSFGHMLRCGKEAINALRLSGNNNGCVWYSAMQAITHATSLGLTVLGFVSPLGRVLTKCPILAALPSMVGYGMDHFQSICTNPDHIINKSGQWGLDNKMINLKGGLGNLVTFTPKLFDFWANKIRAQDEYIFKNYFGVELDRPELFTPTYTELKRA